MKLRLKSHRNKGKTSSVFQEHLGHSESHGDLHWDVVSDRGRQFPILESFFYGCWFYEVIPLSTHIGWMDQMMYGIRKIRWLGIDLGAFSSPPNHLSTFSARGRSTNVVPLSYFLLRHYEELKPVTQVLSAVWGKCHSNNHIWRLTAAYCFNTLSVEFIFFIFFFLSLSPTLLYKLVNVGLDGDHPMWQFGVGILIGLFFICPTIILLLFPSTCYFCKFFISEHHAVRWK